MRYIYERQEQTERQAPRTASSPNYASSLRRELSQLNRKWALDHAFPHEVTRGASPAVLFQEDEAGNHGNFLRASYRAIQQRPEWARRLAKAHTTTRRALLRDEQQSRRPSRSELDSSNSSDALLMNIFCHPKTLASPSVRALLGIEANAEPIFGFKPRVPFLNGRSDCSEIDLKLGDLLIEAKLTEYDFQSAPRKLFERYQDIEEVFGLSIFEARGRSFEPSASIGPSSNVPDQGVPDQGVYDQGVYDQGVPNQGVASHSFPSQNIPDLLNRHCIDSDEPSNAPSAELAPDPDSGEGSFSSLPSATAKVDSYQLLRGVLAAHASPGARFCVLCDARRPDLIEAWHEVLRPVKIYSLRNRLLLLTWQELATTVPRDLQIFLRDKYGTVG
ncbi:MAG TPA: hypothetical protein VGD64_00620 [Acidisarcina sp.]